MSAQGTDRLYLSGEDAGSPRTWDFLCSSGQHSGKWGKIQVPCSWELQGYGAYTYGRFYKTKGLKASDETGRYRTKFTTPRTWRGQTIHLVFEGSMTDTRVWIDGKPLNTLLLEGRNTGKTIHQGAFTEFEYDATPFLIPGKRQTIEVLVCKESANKSINSAERRADWWLFGGIYRPVYFKAMPRQHIEQIAIDARQDGSLRARMRVTYSDKDTKVNLAIKDKEGRDIPLSITDSNSQEDEGNAVVTIQADVKGVKTWDPEHPNLYTVTFSLPEGGHAVSQRIGFRTIEFRPHDGIYLNGTRLVVKGTNRHCFWPETGRAVSKAQSLHDAMLIKQMNMNAVRCHYPSDRHFLDICDSIGLLYLDEFTGWQTRYDDTTAVRLMHEFIPRDVNRACVFLWSNGNEGGWNTCVDPLFSQLDIQDRKVVHPWSDFGGIDTHHYPAYQTGTYRMQNGQNVFMPTEFLHSKYDKGAGSALEDMWSHWTRSPLFAGGFIWAFVDEAVRRRDLGNILDSDGGNGPDGCMDPYRQPEASFFTIREVWSPIYIDRLTINQSFDGRIPVENHYLFTNLSECKMKYFVKTIDGHVLEEGEVMLPAISPGERSHAKFDLPDDFLQGDILQLTAYNKREEVCTWTAPIHRADELTKSQIPDCDNLKVKDISTGEIVFEENGTLNTDDLHGPFPVGMKAEVRDHKKYMEADGTVVNTFYYKGGIDSIQWRQTPDGLLYMDAVVLNDEKGHGYSGGFLTPESQWQVGLTFNYPEQKVDTVRWLGRGPYRVWRNRLKGQQFGLWTKAYNNTVTGQYNTVEPPVYPEFKGYYADVRWMDFGRSLRVYSQTEGLYYRLFTPKEAVDKTPGEMGGMQEGRAPKQERTMIPFPEGDISFLLSIPPMQSYKPLEQLGPLSQPDNIRIKAGDEGFHIRLVFSQRTL